MMRLHSRRRAPGFKYIPRRKKEKSPRSLSRRVLLIAALEEYKYGGDAITSLYCTLLVRALADADEALADEFAGSLAALDS